MNFNINGFFTGYGRPHHWNEDCTTGELGKSGVSFAMEPHNQSGSVEFVECTSLSTTFFLSLLILVASEPLPPPPYFYGSLETKHHRKGDGSMVY